jgi:hypothetical protein
VLEVGATGIEEEEEEEEESRSHLSPIFYKLIYPSPISTTSKSGSTF